ncbi:MAG: acyltransferase family protein [Asgard group archaeon]|nr:acyltransferase family protein [Asgard group archaeon]
MKKYSHIPKVERRYDLDWLRIIAIVLVFFYHCSRFFDAEDWHIKNEAISAYLKGGMSFGYAFILPLFFVISGMGTFYALNYVSAGKYTLLRSIRLLVPFVIGIFTHIPLQVFLEAKLPPFNYTGNFFQFFTQELFFGVYKMTPNGVFPALGHHLWFLVILFVYSLILIGPFVLLRREKTYKRLLNVTSFLAKPGVIFSLVIPVILLEQLNNSLGAILPYIGGYSFYTYIIFIFFGFLIASNKNFKESIEKQIIPALIVTALTGISMIIFYIFKYDTLFDPDYVSVGINYMKTIYWIIFPIYGWSSVILLLGLGSKFMNKNSKARKFLNELVMPFYVLHQTIIIVIGYFIIPVDSLLMISKYLIISSSSLAIIAVLLVIIKYLNPLRVLFGMRWKKGLLQRKPKVEVTIQTTETSKIEEEN